MTDEFDFENWGVMGEDSKSKKKKDPFEPIVESVYSNFDFSKVFAEGEEPPWSKSLLKRPVGEYADGREVRDDREGPRESAKDDEGIHRQEEYPGPDDEDSPEDDGGDGDSDDSSDGDDGDLSLV